MSYNKPKIAFRKDAWNPLLLHYGNAYYPGCFTPTGMLENEDIPKMLKWIEDNNCGKRTEGLDPYAIVFEDEKQMSWFLLHWT
jgi:hypothetical protein